VTRHRWTGRYEAHLWDSSSARVSNTKGRTKGKQVYLGGYESETTAAKAYDRVREDPLAGLHRLGFAESHTHFISLFQLMKQPHMTVSGCMDC